MGIISPSTLKSRDKMAKHSTIKRIIFLNKFLANESATKIKREMNDIKFYLRFEVKNYTDNMNFIRRKFSFGPSTYAVFISN